jgi:hypothetical protein
MNPEHRHRLEQARGRKLAGVDHLESDILAELHDNAFYASIIAAEKHHRSVIAVIRILQIVRAGSVETFHNARGFRQTLSI